MTSAVEVIAMSATTYEELVISIIHKNSDETGDAPNTAATFTTITDVTSGGPAIKRASGLRELVRYKIVLKRATSSGTGTIYAHLRMLEPSWETTGA